MQDLNAREETAKKVKTQTLRTQSIAQEEAIFEYYRIRLEAAREQALVRQRALARQIDQLSRAGSPHAQTRHTTSQDWEYDAELESSTLLRMRQVGKDWGGTEDTRHVDESDGLSATPLGALSDIGTSTI